MSPSVISDSPRHATCLVIVFLTMPGLGAEQVSRPDLPAFYASLATVRAAVAPRCDELEARELEMLLDVARQTQKQIDCQGSGVGVGSGSWN